MKYFRWFWNNIRPFKWPVALSVLCQIVLVGISMTYVFISKALVDLATGDTLVPVPDWAVGADRTRSGLVFYAIAMAVAIVSRILVNAVRNYIQTRTEIRMANSLRLRMFDTILHTEGDFRNKFHSGDMVNRLKNDVSTLAGICCTSIPDMIGTGIQLAAAFAYLLILEKRLAWILIIILPAGVLAGKFIGLRLRDYTKAVLKEDSQVQSHMQESIQHLSVIKTLEYVQNTSNGLGELQSDLYSDIMRRTRFGLRARILTSLAFSGGYTIVFLWSIRGIWGGTITYGLMTAFLQLVGQIQRPLIELGNQLPSIFHSTAAVDRIGEIAELPREKRSEPKLLPATAGVKVTDVTYCYPDGDTDIFNGFSHDFKPGSRTAILGPTGVGKSTLIRLLLSLLEPVSGKIELYDGTTSLPSGPDTRCNLVYVPQGNSLLSGTIRENLLMGCPSATDIQLEEVLHTAAADFVLELPHGLDTPCFETGGGLSEGQAQRIAIARALLRPGSILLLDEFSSALDPQTEKTLLERLCSTTKGKTLIFITHREAVCEWCDTTLRL